MAAKPEKNTPPSNKKDDSDDSSNDTPIEVTEETTDNPIFSPRKRVKSKSEDEEEISESSGSDELKKKKITSTEEGPSTEDGQSTKNVQSTENVDENAQNEPFVAELSYLRYFKVGEIIYCSCPLAHSVEAAKLIVDASRSNSMTSNDREVAKILTYPCMLEIMTKRMAMHNARRDVHASLARSSDPREVFYGSGPDASTSGYYPRSASESEILESSKKKSFDEEDSSSEASSSRMFRPISDSDPESTSEDSSKCVSDDKNPKIADPSKSSSEGFQPYISGKDLKGLIPRMTTVIKIGGTKKSVPGDNREVSDELKKEEKNKGEDEKKEKGRNIP